jgi:adiponectin receptor
MYASLGLTVAFIMHGVIVHGWEIKNHRMSLTYLLITAMPNLLGAVIYTARQVFHLIVVFAGLIHMCGLQSAFDFIHSHSCA